MNFAFQAPEAPIRTGGETPERTMKTVMSHLKLVGETMSESNLIGIIALVVLLFTIAIVNDGLESTSLFIVYGFTIIPMLLSIVFTVLTAYRAASHKSVVAGVYFLLFLAISFLLTIYLLDVADIVDVE
jgi:hypothetical protein